MIAKSAKAMWARCSVVSLLAAALIQTGCGGDDSGNPPAPADGGKDVGAVSDSRPGDDSRAGSDAPPANDGSGSGESGDDQVSRDIVQPEVGGDASVADGGGPDATDAPQGDAAKSNDAADAMQFDAARGDASVGPDADKGDANAPPDADKGDAGRDAAEMFDGATGVPNRIACGPLSCDSSGNTPEYCCFNQPSAARYQCVMGDGVGCLPGQPLFCDSDKGCPAGRVCCWNKDATGASKCALTCGTQVQLCDSRASGECRTGTCQSYAGTDLPPGYATCQ
jgi:hypothetical protein